MKILHLNTYFKLPDDFEGNINDALKELIKYRESIKDKETTEINNDKTPWENFLDSLEQGKNHTGEMFFGEYNYETEEWEHYD